MTIFITGLIERHAVQSSTLHIGSADIAVTYVDGPFPFPTEKLNDWIRTAARAVSAYYGQFPVSHLLVRVSAFEGEGIRGGTTFANEDGTASIYISVGRSTSEEELNGDWMMTHEMVHLGFPSVSREHHWIEEGLATYVEPWARIRIGTLKPVKVWTDVVRDLPKGLPKRGDQGLDRTHTWGRTYWGGALFCLLADVQIRQKTANKKGLEDALKAIDRAGGTIGADWELERAFKLGDTATGTNVFEDLYGKMKDNPFEVDLNSLWRQLGIRNNSGSVSLDNSAPLSAIRRSIESGHS